jgi:hypothetical protein
VAGELLAVDADTLHLLVRDGEVDLLPWARIRRGRLKAWPGESREALGQGGLLALLSVGHGMLGLVTLPFALLSSAAVMNELSSEPVIKVSKKQVEQLRPFARFPGGWPAGLDPATLVLLTPPAGPVKINSLPRRWPSRENP